jgi:hypothetical protein
MMDWKENLHTLPQLKHLFGSYKILNYFFVSQVPIYAQLDPGQVIEEAE